MEGFGSELPSLGSAIQEQGQVSWSDEHCSGLGKHWVMGTEGTWFRFTWPMRPCSFVNAYLLVAAVVVRTWPLCYGLGIPKVSRGARHNALSALDEDSTDRKLWKAFNHSSQVYLQPSLVTYHSGSCPLKLLFIKAFVLFWQCCRLTLDQQAFYVDTPLPLSYIPSP